MRANQADTLAFFAKRGDKGATIREVAEKFDLRATSARSRVLRCLDHEWLKEKSEQGPTGPMRRFFISGAGNREVARAEKAKVAKPKRSVTKKRAKRGKAKGKGRRKAA